MVPITGKYVARRSPAAVPMIQFLGGTTHVIGPDPADQLRALRTVAASLSKGARSRLVEAVESYPASVESTIV